jgi:hypothetical protein
MASKSSWREERFGPRFKIFYVKYLKTRNPQQAVRGPKSNVVLSAVKLPEGRDKRGFTSVDALDRCEDVTMA